MPVISHKEILYEDNTIPYASSWASDLRHVSNSYTICIQLEVTISDKTKNREEYLKILRDIYFQQESQQACFANYHPVQKRNGKFIVTMQTIDWNENLTGTNTIPNRRAKVISVDSTGKKVLAVKMIDETLFSRGLRQHLASEARKYLIGNKLIGCK